MKQEGLIIADRRDTIPAAVYKIRLFLELQYPPPLARYNGHSYIQTSPIFHSMGHR